LNFDPQPIAGYLVVSAPLHPPLLLMFAFEYGQADFQPHLDCLPLNFRGHRIPPKYFRSQKLDFAAIQTSTKESSVMVKRSASC
jgi:hypothetical protein